MGDETAKQTFRVYLRVKLDIGLKCHLVAH